MRLYGLERLREAGEESALQRRHAAWCADLVSGGELLWDWSESVIDVLDVEWANVEAALEYCRRSPPDAEMGLRMACDLGGYWVVRGRYRMGRGHLEALLAMVPVPSVTRALALFSIGFLAQATEETEAALAACKEARRVSAETGGDREMGYALIGLGLVRLRLGELEDAIELLAAARETMQRVNDPVGRTLGLYFLATALTVDGQLTDAVEVAREGLDHTGESDVTLGRGIVGAGLGVLNWLLGDAEGAEARLREAVRIQDRLGHRWGLATSLEGLAWVAASSGRPERASLLLGAAGSFWQELGVAPAPLWRVHHEACEAAVRKELGEVRYRTAWEQGFTLDRGQAMALALEDEVPSARGAAQANDDDDGFELSARELEVARLVADGLSNPAIAATLFVSRATVKTHVSHILRKLALDSRVQLARWVAAHDPARATSGDR
jgi:non-specific serine/threonine protein kinase